MISGVLNVYKEKGYTSHDVVAKLKGMLGQKKIGHTGTLDPQAEGVLPVCLGTGTRLCGMLTDTTKTYRTVLLLGQETDTQDVWGTVEKRFEVNCTVQEAEKAVLTFVGTYDQVPPMYSARKVAGKRLYELAWAGVEVERRAKPVFLSKITIERIKLPEITFTVDCSRGTYIRSLCEDIGRLLGCGGCMKELVRLRVGDFFIKDSLTLTQIEALLEEGTLKDHIRPVDEMFPAYGKVRVCPEADKFLHNGNPIRYGQLADMPKEGSSLSSSQNVTQETASGTSDLEEVKNVRMYDSAGVFFGIYREDAKKGLYVPEKMFPDSRL